MTMYYSNEQDKLFTLDDIRREYDDFQQNGQYTDVSFAEYLTGCMYWENGDLTPVES